MHADDIFRMGDFHCGNIKIVLRRAGFDFILVTCKQNVVTELVVSID